MSEEYTVHQCKMANGLMTKVAWIPSKYAKVGKAIAITESDGPREVWIVEDVYGNPMSYSEANERSQDYKRTREASDI